MDKHNDTDNDLAAFRRQIDAIDDKLIALLGERIEIVKRVGEYKRRVAPSPCHIRAGREAEMIRRIAERFKDSPFSPAAASAIWRIIIGASTTVESELTLSVFTPERDNDLYWLGREYFGPSITITKQPHIKRVIGDVMDGKCSIGIVPVPRSSDASYWWTNLVQQGGDFPKIFAHIPFVYAETPGHDAPSSLAIARIAPEPSGDDMSLVVLEADQNASQSRLQTAFSAAQLEVNWINVATISSISRHHLVEIKGFVTAEHEGMKNLLASLGTAVINVTYLGAYAVPLVLDTKNSIEKKSYAAGSQ